MSRSRDSDPDWSTEVGAHPFGWQELADYRLTTFVFLRGLGFVYYVAFISLATQLSGLLSSHGILPIGAFLRQAEYYTGSQREAIWELPSIFWVSHSDTTLAVCAWLGVALSLACVAGYANAWLMGALWLVYLSFVNVGQIFYGYGWEMLLLETGFLALFLAPVVKGVPDPSFQPSRLVIGLLRLTLFRLMFGAGLIKVRGDSCWLELTCLNYHYETQPNPHPLSWLIQKAPNSAHAAGVLVNHFVELLVPFGYFGPRRVRHIAGLVTIAFQAALILSGNLAFLNWLSIVVALSLFDATFWSKLLPRKLVRAFGIRPRPVTRVRGYVHVALVILVGLLSLNPIMNMLSPRQRMNASFDPLHLVNTYGAFGSVGQQRYEVIFEGSLDPHPGPTSVWKEYEFPCKPGATARAPCLITPFHHRLDWQLWFLPLGPLERQPWVLNLVHRLLEGEASVTALTSHNPFPDTPPRFIRATLYRYRFTTWGEPGYWVRTPLGEYLRPLSLEDEEFLGQLQRFGWLETVPALDTTTSSGAVTSSGKATDLD